MNTEQLEILKKGINKIWIVWAAILFSLFLYVKIGPMLEPTLGALPEDDYVVYVMKISFYCISALFLVFSYFLRNFIMKRRSEQLEAYYIQRAQKTNSHPVVIKYAIAVMISLAISQSIGIFGFVLFLLCRDLQTLYIFAVISAIAMLYHRPKMQELQKVGTVMGYFK